MGNPLEPVTSGNETVTNLPWLLAAVNITGGLVFGYNSGIIAPALLSMKDENAALSASTVQQGILTASMLFGAMIGSLFGGGVGDALGRKKAAALLGFLTVIGAIGSSLFSEVWVIILFREIVGVGVGLSSVICPVYVSELSPPQLKGALGSTFQMAITFGILLAYLVGLIFDQVNWQYHSMFGIGAMPGIMMICISFIMPESHGAKDTYGEIGNLGPSPYIMLFTSQGKYMLIGLVLAVTLQLTGINAIINFAPTIFGAAGLSGSTAQLLATVGVGAWNFVTTFFALFMVERVGRRVLILGGLLVMTVANVAAGILFIWNDNVVSGILSIFVLLVFIAGFEGSIGCLFWPLLTEIFPVNVRDAGASLMNGTQWSFNILLSLFFLPLSDLIGQFTVFWIFAAFGAACTAFLYFQLPETRAQTIE